MLEAHEVIGMDECPPSTFEFNPCAYTVWGDEPGDDVTCAWDYLRRTRVLVTADETFAALDEAYDSGVESDAVFIAWLHRVDVPKCEAREHVAAWREVHPDPWIWAHSYAFGSERELACREVA